VPCSKTKITSKALTDYRCSLTALLEFSTMPFDNDFEWHTTKARSNYNKHGVTLETAKQAFADPFMVEVLDDTGDYGEERYLVIGMVDAQLFSVVYTPRQGRFRLISARRATKDEQDHYFTQNHQGKI
jgi:uncharacterized DUF497 family protein